MKKTTRKQLAPFFIAVAIIGVGIFVWQKYGNAPTVPTPASPAPVTPAPVTPEPVTPLPTTPDPATPDPNVPTEPSPTGFKTVTLTTNKPGSELSKLTGGLANAMTTLAINRIDDKNLTSGMKLTVPESFDDPTIWEFMPAEIAAAASIPKLIMISQRTQAFGFYEYGKLVRTGPVSSGKEATPTPSRLFFTNWKGKEVISTFDDAWILKWNFNLDNFEGVALHHYALPGYPASHSCVRFYEEDAKWLYDWADQWVLAADGQTKLANGTPAIIFGQYDFDNTAPWKKLTTDPDALKVEQSEVETLVASNLAKITQERQKREAVLGQ